MKKLFTVLILIFIFIIPAKAETADDILKNYLDDSGTSKLSEEVPRDTRNNIKDAFGREMTAENVNDFLDFKGILAFVVSSFFKIFKKEAVIFTSVIVVVLLNRLFKSFSSSFSSKSTEGIVDMVSLLALTAAVSINITLALNTVTAMIEKITVFTEALTPVMSALMVSSGQPASASVATVVVFLGCQLCAFISGNLLLPLINIYFAAVICESLIFESEIYGITEFIKKLIFILLGTVLTLFVGIMSLQSVLSGAGDSLAKRGIKFAVGAMLPVASGMLSEAMESVFSCANVARSLAGVFGIMVIIFTVAAPVLMVTSKYILLKIGASVGKITGGGRLCIFLDGCASVFSLLITLTLAVCAILLSSITLVMVNR